VRRGLIMQQYQSSVLAQADASSEALLRLIA
jgi:hypothetical protein